MVVFSGGIINLEVTDLEEKVVLHEVAREPREARWNPAK